MVSPLAILCQLVVLDRGACSLFQEIFGADKEGLTVAIMEGYSF